MRPDQFVLEKVIFDTSPVPPHRQKGLLPADLRYELVAAAVADNPRFEASRLEIDRPGPVLYNRHRLGGKRALLRSGTRASHHRR